MAMGRPTRSELAYEKYGFRDTHGMTNAFSWGFDGWIYACHGFSNESKVEGSDGKPIVMQSGNVYRMKPDGTHGSSSTRMARSTRSAWRSTRSATCTRATATAGRSTRTSEGAFYPSFGKPDDGLGFGPEMITHDHGSTGIGGIAYYAAEHFPEPFRNTIFIGNVVTSRINHDKLTWTGSSTRRRSPSPTSWSATTPGSAPSTSNSVRTGLSTSPTSTTGSSAITRSPSTIPGRDRNRGRIWRIVYKGKDGQGQAAEGSRGSTNRPRRSPSWSRTSATRIWPSGPWPTNQLVDRGGAEATGPVLAMIRGSRLDYLAEGPWPLGAPPARGSLPDPVPQSRRSKDADEIGPGSRDADHGRQRDRPSPMRTRSIEARGLSPSAGLKDRLGDRSGGPSAEALGRHPATDGNINRLLLEI